MSDDGNNSDWDEVENRRSGVASPIYEVQANSDDDQLAEIELVGDRKPNGVDTAQNPNENPRSTDEPDQGDEAAYEYEVEEDFQENTDRSEESNYEEDNEVAENRYDSQNEQQNSDDDHSRNDDMSNGGEYYETDERSEPNEANEVEGEYDVIHHNAAVSATSDVTANRNDVIEDQTHGEEMIVVETRGKPTLFAEREDDDEIGFQFVRTLESAPPQKRNAKVDPHAPNHSDEEIVVERRDKKEVDLGCPREHKSPKERSHKSSDHVQAVRRQSSVPKFEDPPDEEELHFMSPVEGDNDNSAPHKDSKSNKLGSKPTRRAFTRSKTVPTIPTTSNSVDQKPALKKAEPKNYSEKPSKVLDSKDSRGVKSSLLNSNDNRRQMKRQTYLDSQTHQDTQLFINSHVIHLTSPMTPEKIEREELLNRHYGPKPKINFLDDFDDDSVANSCRHKPYKFPSTLKSSVSKPELEKLTRDPDEVETPRATSPVRVPRIPYIPRRHLPYPLLYPYRNYYSFEKYLDNIDFEMRAFERELDWIKFRRPLYYVSPLRLSKFYEAMENFEGVSKTLKEEKPILVPPPPTKPEVTYPRFKTTTMCPESLLDVERRIDRLNDRAHSLNTTIRHLRSVWDY